MGPKPRAKCQICTQIESRYTCSNCMILYCSVQCYKQHKESCKASPESTLHHVVNNAAVAASEAQLSHTKAESTSSDTGPLSRTEEDLTETKPLRPLTSLRWPYVPEESAYPDPLKRDDPKPLQTHQYEAIATSPAIRSALASNTRLPALLASIDKLRGQDREEALQRALGVSPPESTEHFRLGPGSAQNDEDVKALRSLAEAVEAAVRGDKQDVLGLDWGDGE